MPFLGLLKFSDTSEYHGLPPMTTIQLQDCQTTQHLPDLAGPHSQQHPVHQEAVLNGEGNINTGVL